MPAHSSAFPWPSYYGHFRFFEQRMLSHSQVATIQSLGDGLYELTTLFGKTLRVFVCECYSFGVAEYTEVRDAHGRVDIVMINSAWCGYTLAAKKLCRDDKVGLYKIGDLMAALNKAAVWDYLTESEKENFKKNDWR